MPVYGVGYFTDHDMYLYRESDDDRSRSIGYWHDVSDFKPRFAAEGWGKCLFLYSILGNLRGVFVGTKSPPWHDAGVLHSAEGSFDEMWEKFEAYARML